MSCNQDHASKKLVFCWSHPHKTQIMIISLVEMLELPNFGHMTTSTIQFESRNKNLLMMSWKEMMMS